MKSATELLTYLAQIQDPVTAAALFAEDGVIELPWVKARAQGPVGIETFLTGLLAKMPDFSFQNIRIRIRTPDQAFGEYDVEALVPSIGRHIGRPTPDGLSRRTERSNSRGKRSIPRLRHCHSLNDANGLHNINA
jgi:SnoaL-like domain